MARASCEFLQATCVHARQIYDSRGKPTLEAEVTTKNGVFRASVPSGASVGKHEAVELRDSAAEGFRRFGVTTAIGYVNKEIRSAVCCDSVDIGDQEKLDRMLIQLDGRPNKGRLGANSLLGVSQACARASAAAAGEALFERIGRLSGVARDAMRLPMPCFNVINGGAHAGNQMPVQELMVVPVGAKTFSEALMMGAEVYSALRDTVRAAHGPSAVSVGDEGGFAPPVEDADCACDLIADAVRRAGHTGRIRIAIDVAANEFFQNGAYNLGYKTDRPNVLSADALADYYTRLITKHNVVSIEDPFAEDDTDAWAKFTKTHAGRLQIVGDDLLVTNPTRIKNAIDARLCTALLVKPNQIGTLTETIDATRMAQQAGMGVMVSHRSGETEDAFIADLAVGTAAGQIKSGAPCRTERTAKYNQLLRIEEALGTCARLSDALQRYCA